MVSNDKLTGPCMDYAWKPAWHTASGGAFGWQSAISLSARNPLAAFARFDTVR